jgi:endoglucanase
MPSCTDLKRPLLAGLLLSALVGCGKMSNVTRGAGFGVNLAGAEFGALRPEFSNANVGTHGTDYFFPSRDAMVYFANRGLSLVRVPISWERLQPRLGQELDPGYLARILECLDHASQLGCSVVLDMHNYGRYRLQRGEAIQELIVSNHRGRGTELDSSSLVDLWLRLSGHVRNHPAITAYGLMNEPHDMAGADWHATSNEVVSALRGAGDDNWIWVAGDAWSSAEKWDRYNPPRPWVTDRLGRIAYEAHVYFDSNGSGKYEQSFAEETLADPNAAARGRERVQPFLEWCDRNRAVGVIGEFGVPWSDPGWLPVLEDFLTEVRRHNIKACAWAGGDYWGDYPLSLQARDGQDVAPLQRIAWHNSQSAYPLVAQPRSKGRADR